MRINELTSPYRYLAEKRMGEIRGFVDTNCDLTTAFNWGNTKEGGDFWDDVNEGKTPTVPQSSLDELKEYENAKLLPYAKEVKIEYPEPTKDDRLFTAAVAAMQGILANGTLNKNLFSITKLKGRVIGEVVAEYSVNYAKALLQELEKQNHL